MPNVNTNTDKAKIAAQINDNSTENPTKFNIIHAIKQSWMINGRIKFMITALGIVLSYVCVGALQEEIMRGCYGDEANTRDCPTERRFKHAVTLVSVQMLGAYILTKIMDLIDSEPETKDSTHFLYYAGASIANFLATTSSNTALRWVTYPMQVIFKSAKPIAVMIIGLVICKRYPIQRYFFVVLIVIGVVVFKLFESKDGKPDESIKWVDGTNWEEIGGIGLLILSVSMDGILGNIQDRITHVYAPSFRQMMRSITLYGFIISGTVALVKGELYEVCKFAQVHPQILWHLTSITIAASIGQLFIFMMVSSFGSLACSITTTVRKFFSVVFSIIFFRNPSTPIQWVGAVLVFSALIADAFFGKRKCNTEPDDTDIEVGERHEKLMKTPETAEIAAKIVQQNV